MLTTAYATSSVRIATSRNLILGAWTKTPTVADLGALEKVAHGMNRDHATGCGLLSLILGGTPQFPDDVRAEFVRLNGDPTLFSLASARALLVPGLAASAVRAFFSTVTLKGKSDRPTQAFTSLPDATAWLAPRLSVGGAIWTPSDVTAVAKPVVEAAKPAE
jgi:hypothetical protein